MRRDTSTKGWIIAVGVALLMAHIGYAEARGGGRGGGGRGGGFSRQGPAAGGGFSSQRSRTPSAAPSHRQAAPATRPQQQPAQGGTAPSTRQQPAQAGAGQRAGTQPAVGDSTTRNTAGQQGTRPEERTERQENRQEGRTERQENRQEAYDDIDVYYPPYGGYYDDDWDNWDVAVGVMVGGVVGAAVASEENDDDDDDSDSSFAALPCNPEVTQQAGVTYFRCGQTYYVQAYGSDGPIYMPVAAPK